MYQTSHSPEGAAFTRLVLEVFRLNGLLLSEGDRLGGDIGLTSARWQVLGALSGAARTVPQIAREMGLSRQAVQRTVTVLEDEGLVALRHNPDHRRAKLVELTAIGRERLDTITARQIEWANQISAGVSLSDLETAGHLLERLRLELAAQPDPKQRRAS